MGSIVQNGGSGSSSALEARITTLEDARVKATYFAIINAAAGTIAPPSGATIELDEFASSVDALVSTIDGNNNPTFQTPQTAGGAYIAASLDVNGNYVLSGTPTGNIALIYVYSIARKDFDYTLSLGHEEANLFTDTDKQNLETAYERSDPEWIIQNPFFFDDFHTDNNWTGAVSGGSISLTSTADADTNSIGIVRLLTGVTSTGRSALLLVKNSSIYNWMVLGSKSITLKIRVRISALSTLTDEYYFLCGLNSSNNSEGNNGIYFLYNRLSNSNFWTCVCRQSGVETKTITAIPVSTNTYYTLTIVVNSLGSQVEFYIDGVLVATHSTNIPTASQYVAPCFLISKTAGTSNTFVSIDYWYHKITGLVR